jgi:hypothetical protein
MNKILFLLFACCLSLALNAQKKSRGKDKHEKTDYDSIATAPVTTKSSKKDDKKDKKGKKDTKSASVNYTPDVIMPEPDTSKKFTGIIKYLITSDDPADKDSVIMVFGESRIRVTMFETGLRADQVFEKNMIANPADSSFLELDTKKMTYKTEKLSARNAGTEFSLVPDKKMTKIMSFTCDEFKGEMTTKEGETFEAACLVSKQHYFNSAIDYNFMNIHPLVLGYRIVLGFRTKSAENENTYIMAYKIEPGKTDAYFDLSGYRAL